VEHQTGALKSRSPLHSEFTTSLPGAPTGKYVVVQYKSKYAKTSSAVETVIMMLDADQMEDRRLLRTTGQLRKTMNNPCMRFCLIAIAAAMIPATAMAATFTGKKGYQVTVPAGWTTNRPA